jgi:hypothetical protein
MPRTPEARRTVRCSCGSVELEANGAPILSAACYCDDCQEGWRRIEALPNAPGVRDPHGGTPYLLYRRDRVRCAKGAELLTGHKLAEASATSRVVATCCNSAMYLDFARGHWLSIHRGRFEGDVFPTQMRVQTKFRAGSGAVPSDVPDYPGFPPKFLAKLLAARIAMLLGR